MNSAGRSKRLSVITHLLSPAGVTPREVPHRSHPPGQSVSALLAGREVGGGGEFGLGLEVGDASAEGGEAAHLALGK
jgi:hypothetical protein